MKINISLEDLKKLIKEQIEFEKNDAEAVWSEEESKEVAKKALEDLISNESKIKNFKIYDFTITQDSDSVGPNRVENVGNFEIIYEGDYIYHKDRVTSTPISISASGKYNVDIEIEKGNYYSPNSSVANMVRINKLNISFYLIDKGFELLSKGNKELQPLFGKVFKKYFYEEIKDRVASSDTESEFEIED